MHPLMIDLISGFVLIMDFSSFCLMIENEYPKNTYLIDLNSICSARSARHNVSPWNRSVTHHTCREMRRRRFTVTLSGVIFSSRISV